MSASEPAIALPVTHVLGEGPRWNGATGELVWVDVEVGLVRRASLDGLTLGEVATIPFDAPVGFVAPYANGSLLVGAGTELIVLDRSGAQTVVFVLDAAAPGPIRWNDGFVDPAGRVWAGTMGCGAERGWGAVYRIDDRGSTLMLSDLTIPNGMGWSPDHATMYITESVSQRISAQDFDVSNGTLGPARPFVEIPGERDGGGDLGPDGMCVDSEGAVWTAVWGGGEVRRYLPDGTLDRTIPVPATQPTACAFAGADLRTLVITSARLGLETPRATDGYLFATEVDVPGVLPTAPLLG